MTGPELRDWQPTRGWAEAYLGGDVAAVPAWEDADTREVRHQLATLLRGDIPFEQRRAFLRGLLNRAGRRQRHLQAAADCNREVLRALGRVAVAPEALGLDPWTQAEAATDMDYSQSYFRELVHGRSKSPTSKSAS